MRLLIVMEGFFPGKKYGGPPVSIDNFCSLMKEHECYIVTHNHDLFESEKYEGIKHGWNDRDNCEVLYLNDKEYGKSKFEEVIKELNPDLLYLQGLFQSCILPCLELAKKYNIKVLLAPRGELCKGALSMKRWKKIPYIYAIRGLFKGIHFQSTSEEETMAIEKWMNTDASHIHRLDNIPSIPSHEYPRREKEAGKGKFVFLSRIHPKKNLLSAIKYFHDVEGEAIFDIYGPIEEEEYWNQCQDEIKTLPSNVKVKYKGLISHDQVHAVFSQYDAFLFPTYSENYGHVIAESLVVGTTVIISNQTPWRGLEEAGVGWDIPLDNSRRFVEVLQIIISTSKSDYEEKTNQVKKYINQKLEIESIYSQYQLTLETMKGEIG